MKGAGGEGGLKHDGGCGLIAKSAPAVVDVFSGVPGRLRLLPPGIEDRDRHRPLVAGPEIFLLDQFR